MLRAWLLWCSCAAAVHSSSLTPAMMEGQEPMRQPNVLSDAMTPAATTTATTITTTITTEVLAEDDNDQAFADIMNSMQQTASPVVSEAPHVKLNVLVAVLSAPANSESRRAIRDTWMTLNSLRPRHGIKMDIKFFVGVAGSEDVAREVDKERETFPDVEFLPELRESYHNLTRKTALMMLHAHSKGYDAMLKLDDDDFVQVDLLVSGLASMADTSNLYWGRIKRNVTVNRDPTHKWYDTYPAEQYPPYMLGSGYLVGKRVLEMVATKRLEGLQLFANEDASVGIWTQDMALELTPMRQMVLQPWCDDEAVVVNSVEPREQYTLMENKMQQGHICARSFYLQVCRQEPCKCCVDPASPNTQDGPCCA